MALIPLVLGIIKTVSDEIKSEFNDERRVLSLGYPDILAKTSTIKKIFGETTFDTLKIRDDSTEIARWHKAPGVTEIIDASDFFSSIGFQLDVIDINRVRGNEIIHDLSYPVDEQMQQRYALVIDAGTCEHCFSFAQAIANVAQMTAIGGYVIQSNPLNQLNHGFYNINPTLYYDFYTANGFEIKAFKLVSRNGELISVMSLDNPYKPFNDIPANCSNLVVAKRIRHTTITYPMQTKYQINPTLTQQS